MSLHIQDYIGTGPDISLFVRLSNDIRTEYTSHRVTTQARSNIDSALHWKDESVNRSPDCHLWID